MHIGQKIGLILFFSLLRVTFGTTLSFEHKNVLFCTTILELLLTLIFKGGASLYFKKITKFLNIVTNNNNIQEFITGIKNVSLKQ